MRSAPLSVGKSKIDRGEMAGNEVGAWKPHF